MPDMSARFCALKLQSVTNRLWSFATRSKQQLAEVRRLKLAERQLATNLQTEQAGSQQFVQERAEVAQQLETAQARSQQLEDRVALLEHQSSQDKQQTSSLEAQVKDLTRVLRDREAAIDQQQELLAHDRDIRDLIGARDLYVAEVYDVERTGETKKPYGRVFYTKGKSLNLLCLRSRSTGPYKERQQFPSLGTAWI